MFLLSLKVFQTSAYRPNANQGDRGPLYIVEYGFADRAKLRFIMDDLSDRQEPGERFDLSHGQCPVMLTGGETDKADFFEWLDQYLKP